jgi:hypothetical protein
MNASWRFFETVDQDIQRLSRFIEFSPANYPTYSVELARLYLSVCSEIDVIAKQLCSKIDPNAKAGDIKDYQVVICQKYPNFSAFAIEMPSHQLSFIPWGDWQNESVPGWWTGHNKVKHMRDKYFAMANLKNVLEASSGLLVILTYFYQADLYSIVPPPTLIPAFSMFRYESRYFASGTFVPLYSFPDFGQNRNPGDLYFL